MVPSWRSGVSGTLPRYLHLRAEDLVSVLYLLSDIVWILKFDNSIEYPHTQPKQLRLLLESRQLYCIHIVI